MGMLAAATGAEAVVRDAEVEVEAVRWFGCR
jgi:hypothetical protein